MIRKLLISTVTTLAFASPASAQWGWPTDPQECTFIAGAAQLSIAGSTLRTCGAMSHGTSVVVTDAIADDCSNVTGATGGGTGALVVQWDSSLGAAGEWKCPTVLPGGFTPNPSPSVNHSGFDAAADARIAAAPKTGADVALVTGTAGSDTHCAQWDVNGDLVTAGAACGGTPFSPNASPTFNHSAFNAEADARIAAATKTGLDVALVTGTAGSDTHCAQWDANGDLVTAGAACGGTQFSPNASPTFNHSAFNAEADARIAAATKTGLDAALVTGTKGLSGDCAEWDANGDLVTAGAACGTGDTLTASSAAPQLTYEDTTFAGGTNSVEVTAEGLAANDTLYRVSVEMNSVLDTFLEVDTSAAGLVTIGDGKAGEVINLDAPLVEVFGTLKADAVEIDPVNGANQITLSDNTITHTCQAGTNERDIFVQSAGGTLTDLLLSCDDAAAVREISEFGVRGAANPRLSLLGVDDAIQLKIDANTAQTANVIEVRDSSAVPIMSLDDAGNFYVQRIGDIDGPNNLWTINNLGNAKFNDLRLRSVTDAASYFDAVRFRQVVNSDAFGNERVTLYVDQKSGGTLYPRLKLGEGPASFTRGETAADSGIQIQAPTGLGTTTYSAPVLPSGAGTENHVMRHKSVSFVTASATVANAAFRDGLVIVSSSTDTDIVLTLPTPSIVGIGGNACISYRSGADGTEVLEVKPDAASTIYTQSNDGLGLADGLSAIQVGASICLVATTSTTWQTLSMKKSWTLVAH